MWGASQPRLDSLLDSDFVPPVTRSVSHSGSQEQQLECSYGWLPFIVTPSGLWPSLTLTWMVLNILRRRADILGTTKQVLPGDTEAVDQTVKSETCPQDAITARAVSNPRLSQWVIKHRWCQFLSVSEVSTDAAVSGGRHWLSVLVSHAEGLTKTFNSPKFGQ